ncbi:MAG TPA: nucleotide disphospho-sugar-binding domain-containing protein [Rugosimonospora sp.]|nr:nucleotide disphospho-sugar-binding domain-containing protein [Rugosimonospora sp.]
MHVLFTVFGARPHLYPLVPLAWACRAAGHEVRLATVPRMVDAVTATGLAAAAVGGPPRLPAAARQELADAVFSQEPWPVDWVARIDQLDAARLAHLRSVGRYLVAVAEAMVDDLVSYARDWPAHVVVYDSFSYAGPLAAAATGVPAVRHLSGTDSAQRLELDLPGDAPLPEYRRMFDRFGLPALTTPALAVDPTPPSLRLAAGPRLLGMRFVPYNGAGTHPRELAGRRTRPRVCVTWGHTIPSAAGTAGANPFRESVAALDDLGVDSVVVSTAEEIGRLGRLPDSARVAPSAPLHLVLPYCDAIVHQGGDGTALTAATAALPQLVISGSPEADLAGGRLAAAGVATHLYDPVLRRQPDGRAVLREALGTLLAGARYRDAARRLRAEIEAQPAPTELVPELATLARRPVRS